MKFSGTKLRTLRREADLTQRQLAKTSGVSRGTIKRLENDSEAGATTTTVESLAGALGVSPAVLFVSQPDSDSAEGNPA